MDSWQRFQTWMAAYEHRRAIRLVRGGFAAFGYDLSELSDKELEEGLNSAGRQFARAGISAEEAIRAMAVFDRTGLPVELVPPLRG